MNSSGKRWVVVLFLFCASICHAQWVTQNIEVAAGWNAIYLTAQPVPADCSVVFDGLPVERVVQWGRVPSGTEFISDTAEELPRAYDWLVWRPQGDDDAALNDFDRLQAGGAYLVKMTNAASVSLKSRAVLVHPQWLPNAMTLTGLPAADGVNFADYFSHTDEIGVESSDGGEIYEVLTDGSERAVYRPSQTHIAKHQAYWIKAGQILDYDGALDVLFSEGGDFLDFGSTLLPRRLQLKNSTDVPRSVTIELLDSEDPPVIDGQSLELLQGPVPLLMMQFDSDTGKNEYVPMPSTVTTNIAPHATVELTLIPQSDAMQHEDPQAVWESVLRISDGEVMQVAGIRCRQAAANFSDSTGLWVGNVAVTAVSRAPSRTGASNVWDTTTPVAVSRPYTFRVLIHVSGSGECRLLQRAIPAWLPAAEGAEPDPYIFTDAQYASTFKQDNPDAKMVHISTAALPLMDPELMVGTFGGSNTLDGTVVLPHNDPVNPFVHPFHPDHDNREIRNGESFDLEAGDESYDVARAMRFAFSETDPLGANPKWRISEQGGMFTETVTGLNKTIYVEGAFRLQKVSDCGILSYLE